MEERDQAQKDFADVTAATPPDLISVWQAEILEAESRRSSDISMMDIMANRIEKGKRQIHFKVVLLLTFHIVKRSQSRGWNSCLQGRN